MNMARRLWFLFSLLVLAQIPAAPDSALGAQAGGAETAPARTVKAEQAQVTEWYEAVGVVRPKLETTVESQVQAKILEVAVHPGQTVTKGQTLIVLDGRELQSRAEQAEQAVKSAQSAQGQAEAAVRAAQAAYDNAVADHGRIATLFKSQTVTAQEMDRSNAEYLKADAALRQAKDGLLRAEAQAAQAQKALEESRIAAGYARIAAQEDGEASKRLVDPGDLALPGKPLLVIQTGRSLRLEALAPEGLIARIKPGDVFPVAITALERSGQAPERIVGTVEEVVPSADPVTRTFVVKAALPKLNGAYPGMFGRLLIPLSSRKAVLVPREAVRRVGQLETVSLNRDGKWRNLAVTTGAARDGKIEILSGLDGGEELVVFPTQP